MPGGDIRPAKSVPNPFYADQRARPCYTPTIWYDTRHSVLRHLAILYDDQSHATIWPRTGQPTPPAGGPIKQFNPSETFQPFPTIQTPIRLYTHLPVHPYTSAAGTLIRYRGDRVEGPGHDPRCISDWFGGRWEQSTAGHGQRPAAEGSAGRHVLRVKAAAFDTPLDG